MASQTSIATRNTKQKGAIRSAFVETDRPLSPEEVLSYAQRGVPDLSIATVYRNLKTMVEEGWLLPVPLPGKSRAMSFPARSITTTFSATRADGCTNSNAAFPP